MTLVYPHIPKTAGTTMMGVLQQNYGQGFYRIKNEGDRLKWVKKSKTVRSSITCLTGHIRYGMHEYVPGPCEYVTMLRDPVDRILSLYYYVRHKNHQLAPLLTQITVKEFVEAKVISDTDNGMTRFLCNHSEFGQMTPNGNVTVTDLETAMDNLIKFAYIGFMETFNESLRGMGRKFEWDNIRYVSKLINIERPSATDLPQRAINYIKESNELDYELYRFGKKLMGREP